MTPSPASLPWQKLLPRGRRNIIALARSSFKKGPMPLGGKLVRELLGLPSSKEALILIAVGQPMHAR